MFKTGGLLVSLEGIDGCGKSTQFELLQARLAEKGIPFIAVREPGGTAVGEGIRKVLLQTSYSLTTEAEMLLYLAARAELCKQIILPSLREGKMVLCDRFIDSTQAYQGYGGGLDLRWIKQLNWQVTGGRLPDLTFILNLSVEKAAERRGSSLDRLEMRDLSYHRRVQQGYLKVARQEPERVEVLDAAMAKDNLFTVLWSKLQPVIEMYYKMRSDHDFQ